MDSRINSSIREKKPVRKHGKEKETGSGSEDGRREIEISEKKYQPISFTKSVFCVRS